MFGIKKDCIWSRIDPEKAEFLNVSLRLEGDRQDLHVVRFGSRRTAGLFDTVCSSTAILDEDDNNTSLVRGKNTNN